MAETEARALFVSTEIELEMTPEMAAELTNGKEEGEDDG